MSPPRSSPVPVTPVPSPPAPPSPGPTGPLLCGCLAAYCDHRPRSSRRRRPSSLHDRAKCHGTSGTSAPCVALAPAPSQHAGKGRRGATAASYHGGATLARWQSGLRGPVAPPSDDGCPNLRCVIDKDHLVRRLADAHTLLASAANGTRRFVHVATASATAPAPLQASLGPVGLGTEKCTITTLPRVPWHHARLWSCFPTWHCRVPRLSR